MHPPLSNRYQNVRPIGTGALTTVLQAWDRETGRAVAIKVPIGQLAHDKVFLLRLERELAAMAGFTHPNVARLLAVERGGEGGFVVGELIEGGSLAGILAARGPLPPAQAAQLAATVCAALAAAHAHGIVHGHLTPANVLLAVDGQVKLTDFRVAKAAEPLPSAPDPGADLRALGRLLAAMLTGREPAEGEPIRLERTVPAELAATVSRAVDRVEPYPSATEIGCDLDRFLATIHPDAIRTEHRPPSAASDTTDPLIDSAPSPSTALVASPAASPRLRDAGDAAPAPTRRRRGLAVAAGLIGAGLLVAGTVTAVMRLDREPNGAALDVGQAMAAPPSTVPATSTSGPQSTSTTSRASATTATTIAAPAATSRPTATTGRVLGPGQRIVPDVRGLHRERAADVLAQAQLGMESSPFPVRDPGQVQRVVAQQPAAGEVVRTGSRVTVLVGTMKPSSL
jgi:eukaryotic-like serine/threonine-protein kinase